MTVYRYDVILHVGDEEPATMSPTRLDYRQSGLTLQKVRRPLEEIRPNVLAITVVPNTRIAASAIAPKPVGDRSRGSVGDLQKVHADAGVDPEELVRLIEDQPHLMDMRWTMGADDGRFDVGFRNRDVDVNHLAPGALLVDDSSRHCFRVDRDFQRMREQQYILFTAGGMLRAPSPLRQTLYVPADLEQVLPAIPAEATGNYNPQYITGCVLSSLLAACRADLPPTGGLAPECASITTRPWSNSDTKRLCTARATRRTKLSTETSGDGSGAMETHR